MPQTLRQGFAVPDFSESASTLDRAIARADLAMACLRASLPVLVTLGVADAGARQTLRDMEKRAEALRDRRYLLGLPGVRNGKAP